MNSRSQSYQGYATGGAHESTANWECLSGLEMSTLGLTGTGGVVSCLAHVTLMTERLWLTTLFSSDGSPFDRAIGSCVLHFLTGLP